MTLTLPGTGTPVYGESIGGVEFSATKIYLGLNGVNGGPIDVTNPLPVNLVGGTVTFVQAGTWSMNFADFGGSPVMLGQTGQAGSIPVTMADDQPPITVSLTPSKTATGWTPFPTVVTANGLNLTQIKAAPGQLGSLTAFNTSAQAEWVKFYDSLLAPTVGTTAPIETIGIPTAASVGGVAFSWGDAGIKFVNGLWMATTLLKDRTDASIVGAGDMAINVAFA
jgi:hypothetical protein